MAALGALIACRKDLEGVDVLHKLPDSKNDAHHSAGGEEERSQEIVQIEDGSPVPLCQESAQHKW